MRSTPAGQEPPTPGEWYLYGLFTAGLAGAAFLYFHHLETTGGRFPGPVLLLPAAHFLGAGGIATLLGLLAAVFVALGALESHRQQERGPESSTDGIAAGAGTDERPYDVAASPESAD